MSHTGRRIISVSSLVHIAKRNEVFLLVLWSVKHILAHVEPLQETWQQERKLS